MHNGTPPIRLDTSLEALLDGVPRDGGADVLATLVATAGSTYRKPGARMLIQDDGFVGLLSGGCLEADLHLHARQVLRTGEPAAVDYDMRGPDDLLFGMGAGCEGAMRILLEPVGPGTRAAASLASAARITRLGQATSLVVVHDSALLPLGTYDAEALAAEALGRAALPSAAPALQMSAPILAAAARTAIADAESRQIEFTVQGCRTRAFAHFLAPAPHLLICGAGPDAKPVVAAAVTLGWRVSVVDHRPAYAAAGRFPGAAVHRADACELRATVALDACHAAVVMSHHLPSDVAYLRELADAGTPAYVGLLGPAARRERISHELGDRMQRLRSRLRGPVGLDIGAVTPEGIGLSIISQIHATLAGRENR